MIRQPLNMESRIQIPEMKTETETETESRIKRKIRKQSSHSIIWSFKIKSQVRKEFVFVIVYRSIKSSHDGVQAYVKSIPALLTMILRRLDKVTQQVFVYNYLRTTFLVSILYILSVWNSLSCANMIYRDDFATMQSIHLLALVNGELGSEYFQRTSFRGSILYVLLVKNSVRVGLMKKSSLC